MARVLVVDDEKGIRSALAQVLEYEGHLTRTAADGAQAVAAARDFEPHLTFLDVKMPGPKDGLGVLEDLKAADPDAIVVMISGHGTIDTALDAVRAGAHDFLEKPLDTDRVLVTVKNALRVRGLADHVAQLRGEIESRHRIVGGSPELKAVLERVERVAPTDSRVLITGENGTGKELVARAIHRLSMRAGRPFVEVNCAAIPSELIESDLFGHVKGAFTGAVARQPGKFVQADGGTLFLDEVGDMSLAAQAKVLRVLEEGKVTPVGGTRSIAVDVRVVTATNRDLEEAIEEGIFREDLYYRVNVVPVSLPPLRDRRSDIPMLVQHFADGMRGKGGVKAKAFSREAVELLAGMPWPGNVRELRNTVERLVILSPGDTVTAGDVVELTTGRQGDGRMESLLDTETFVDFRERAERTYLDGKLRENRWNVAETARKLGMQRSNLYKKIERYGLAREA